MKQLPLKAVETFQPSLKSLKTALGENLTQYFADVNVKLEPCPDLNESPFRFPISNISKGAILDVGGPANLLPTPNKSKKYSLEQLLDLCNILHVPNEIIFGSCAGPFWEMGKNCEMVACKKSSSTESDSFLGYVDESSDGARFKCSSSNNFGLLGNFFVCSEEEESTILRIKAKTRLTNENFTNAIRNVISQNFPNQVVSLGGVFSVTGSQTNCHVMPDFSQEPLENDKMVQDWLNFYEFDESMTFASVLHSHDPGLNLRMEHSHGYNEERKQLGHYHYDLNPETVEYDGVFALATKVVRIDMP